MEKWDSPKTAFAKLVKRLGLTERQKLALARHREGENMASIARRFGVSPPTIKKDIEMGKAKEVELVRTITCPHCLAEISIYTEGK